MSPSQKDDDGQGWEDISLPDTKSLHWACRYCRTWNSPERENCVECRRWAERWMGGKRVFDPDVLLPRSELEALISQAIANHRDAQQLREQVTRLQEEIVTQTARGDEFRRIVYNDTDALARAHERVRLLEEALRKRGKCFHCQGTGKPNCVTCDDYQACRCRPGEGRYAEHCWNCKGTGLNAWAAALLSPAAATEGGEGA